MTFGLTETEDLYKVCLKSLRGVCKVTTCYYHYCRMHITLRHGLQHKHVYQCNAMKNIQAPFNPATALNFAFNDMKKNCDRETRIETCKQWMGI